MGSAGRISTARDPATDITQLEQIAVQHSHTMKIESCYLIRVDRMRRRELITLLGGAAGRIAALALIPGRIRVSFQTCIP